METFKMTESPSSELRNCGNCLHRYPERMPGQLMPSLVCHRFPPQVVAVPAPAAPPSPIQLNARPPGIQYQMMSMFPIVQPNQFCHSHTLRSDTSEGESVEEPDAVPLGNGHPPTQS